MKKIIFSALFVVLGFSTYAQEFQFGIKAGMNGSSIAGYEYEGYDDTGMRIGIHAGVFAELPLSERFSLQPELMYSQQGSQIEGWDINNDLEYYEEEIKNNVNYLILPVLAKYYATKNLSIEAGPQVGLLLKYNYEREIRNEYSGNENFKGDATEYANNIDFGVAAGVSYKLLPDLAASARYIFSFTDIDPAVRNKNSVFQFSVAYNLL